MWEYRVFKTTYGEYEIREVYPNIRGDGKMGFLRKKSEPSGENLKELEEDIKYMLQALEKPVVELVRGKLVEVGKKA